MCKTICCCLSMRRSDWNTVCYPCCYVYDKVCQPFVGKVCGCVDATGKQGGMFAGAVCVSICGTIGGTICCLCRACKNPNLYNKKRKLKIEMKKKYYKDYTYSEFEQIKYLINEDDICHEAEHYILELESYNQKQNSLDNDLTKVKPALSVESSESNVMSPQEVQMVRDWSLTAREEEDLVEQKHKKHKKHKKKHKHQKHHSK